MARFVSNSGGYYLIVGKDGNQPLLFMEWLRDNRIAIDMVFDSKEFENCFSVKLNAVKKEYLSAEKYINDNL